MYIVQNLSFIFQRKEKNRRKCRITCKISSVHRCHSNFYFTDTQDVDLDAILGELCALESQYKDDNNSSSQPTNGEQILSSSITRSQCKL